MRVMVLVKATRNSETEHLTPTEEDLLAMGAYNEELVKAGIMITGEGLLASSSGKRVRISSKGSAVEDGPFKNPEELVAGFWIWEVRSMEEAVEWARRCPNPMPGDEGVLELRPIAGIEAFGEAYTSEVREQEDRLREQLETQHKKV